MRKSGLIVMMSLTKRDCLGIFYLRQIISTHVYLPLLVFSLRGYLSNIKLLTYYIQKTLKWIP